MYTFLYRFFHHETNDRTEKGLVNIPEDKESWPESWKRITCKRYALFRETVLPRTNGFLFEKILRNRRSSEGHIVGNSLTLFVLSYILQCGYGLQGGSQGEKREASRTVPSGGGRYPLEVYVLLFKPIDTCVSGIYHYSVKHHSLEPVVLAPIRREDISSMAPEQAWLQDTNGMICITSVFQRTVEKYGSRGYRYILLEAGHVAQNMLLAGTEKGVNIIPIGGVEADQIEKRLGLSGGEEGITYTLFL
jgi:SagB-type dehydrogenase family enzyme